MTPWSSHLDDDQVAIFLFHGVIRHERTGVRNYTRKHLPLDEFAAIVRDLRAHGTPVSMTDIAAADGDTALPPRAFAMTFDDGFANNASVAAPVLADLGVPATFYVTTGFVDRNAASWIDLIEFAVERTPTVRLDIPVLQARGSWTTRDEKRTLLEHIRKMVKASRDIDPDHVVATIWDQSGIDAFDPDPDIDQKLTWDDVRALDADPLFVVGGHSHTHRILEFLPQRELQAEVETSIELLRRHLGRDVEHYSYPEGLAHCYSDRVIRLLQQHGIKASPTAEPGTNPRGADLFRLKRMMVV